MVHFSVVIEAINKYGKPSILNSDQGSQFTSEEYIQILFKKIKFELVWMVKVEL